MTKSQKARGIERKREYYYKEAKKHNARARSYFKLEQINNKFELIKNDMRIIDLGCAPGGWLQYIDRQIEKAKIFGIDLLEVKNQKEFSDNVEIIQDDFDEIEYYIKDENDKIQEFDLILSDMAPEYSGKAAMDKGVTHKLNLKTINFAKKYLKEGGNLAFKTFEGEDLDYVRNRAKNVFHEVREFKPKSSQMKTPETFIICLNKK